MAVIKPEYVFIHVPKCGGTSVTKALGGTSQYVPMHVPARCLAHLNRPMIGFLRNPFERMVSLYYFLWRSPDRHRQRVKPEEIKAMGFKRWLLEGENWMSNEPIDGDISWYGTGMKYKPAKEHPYPGLDHLEDPRIGLPPQQRRSVRFYLDHPHCTIGFVESMERDLNLFLGRHGAAPVRIPRLNKTAAKPRDWQAEYDSETIAHVEHYFAWDIRTGRYPRP